MGNEKLVLVGVVNREKDLEIIFKEHWYRIPLRYAPKRKPDYFAFYQTKIFGKRGRCINYYASIKSSSLLLRGRLLPEEKGHPRAKKLYYKFSLGPVRTTQRIENKTRRRVSFGFTTLGKLKRAREISELFEIIPLEEIMRKALKQKGIKAFPEYCLMEKGRLKYRLDFAIFSPHGKIDVECDDEKWHGHPRQQAKDKERNAWLKRRGWKVVRFSGEEIRNNLKGCFVYLQKVINN